MSLILLDEPTIQIPWPWIAGAIGVLSTAIVAAARYVFKWIRDGQQELIAAQKEQISISTKAIDAITLNIGSEIKGLGSEVKGLAGEVRSAAQRAVRPRVIKK